jgi:hypothetical protein
MTRDDALSFLRSHQPLPADEDLSDDLIQEYDEVRRFFLQHPDPACIPLFLGSFGEGSGFGVYQLVEDVLLPLGPDQVVPHLSAALVSSCAGVRYWCAQIAGAIPDARLVPALFTVLGDPISDIRVEAAFALGRIGGAEVRDRLRALVDREADQEVLAAIQEALAE